MIGAAKRAIAAWDTASGSVQPPNQQPTKRQGQAGQAAVQPVQPNQAAQPGAQGTAGASLQWVRTYGGFFTPGASLASVAGAGPFLSPLGEGLADFAKFSPSVKGPVSTLKDLPAEAWTRLGQAPSEGYQRRTFAHFVNVSKPLVY